MSNERLGVTLDEDYAAAIGRTTYVFAYLEWQAVWCAERLQPGFLADLGTKTAGQIGAAFEQLVLEMTDETLKAQMLPLAREFRTLVRDRNSLLHGKPGTVSESGRQRLFRDGSPWEIADLETVADRFASCSAGLNRIFYGTLQARTS